MKKRTFSPEQLEAMRQQYSDRLPYSEIAIQFKCSENLVYLTIMRNFPDILRSRKIANLTKEQIERIHALNEQGVSVKDIAQQIGCAEATVKSRLSNRVYSKTPKTPKTPKPKPAPPKAKPTSPHITVYKEGEPHYILLFDLDAKKFGRFEWYLDKNLNVYRFINFHKVYLSQEILKVARDVNVYALDNNPRNLQRSNLTLLSQGRLITNTPATVQKSECVPPSDDLITALCAEKASGQYQRILKESTE